MNLNPNFLIMVILFGIIGFLIGGVNVCLIGIAIGLAIGLIANLFIGIR